jgi:hypothetical protein
VFDVCVEVYYTHFKCLEQIVVIAFRCPKNAPNKEVKTRHKSAFASHSRGKKSPHKTINHPFLLLILFHAALSVTKGMEEEREESKVCFVDYSAHLTINFASSRTPENSNFRLAPRFEALTRLAAWEKLSPPTEKKT